MDGRKALLELCGVSDYGEDCKMMCIRENNTMTLIALSDGKVEKNTFHFDTGELVEGISWLCKDVQNVPSMPYWSITELFNFCTEIFLQSEYCKKAVEENLTEFERRNYRISMSQIGKFYYLMCHNSGLLESLLKTDVWSLMNSLDSIDIKEKAVKKAVVFTSDVLEWFKELEMGTLMNEFSKVMSNDEMKIFINFANHSWFRKKYDKTEVTRTFLPLARVMHEDVGCRLVDVLRYLLRQTYIHSEFSREKFLDAMRVYRDYTQMRLDRKAQGAERFPNHLYKAHNLLAKNASMFNDVDDDAFKNGVSSYEKALTKDFEVDGFEYIVIAPQTLQDLFNEGSSLHHCVASYGKLIAKRETAVMFLRKKEDENTPWITLEVQNRRVTQACANWNEDCMTSHSDIIKAYERRI